MSDSSSLIEPRLLKGFRDISSTQMLVRQHMIEVIASTLQRFAFLPLETPVLEYADILLGKLGDEGEKLLYQFKDHGDRQVAMRYDLTVPLARYVAQNSQLAKPFKRYQVGPVWRADNSQRGRYREFYQFDADIVGSDSPMADAEILVVIQQILLALGINEFVIRISDRQLINDFAADLQLNDRQTAGLFKVLDNLEKVSWDQSKDRLHELGFSSFDVDRVRQELLTTGQDLATKAPRLKHILDLAKQLGLQDKYVQFDPSIVRGLDYYSGLVFETQLTNIDGFGSIFSGGRYDGLVSRFSKQQLPAVGASVGLDRLIAALEESQALPNISTPIDVVVTLFDDDKESVSASLQVSQTLRDQGLNVSMNYSPSSIGKQCKAAAEVGVPWAVIIGPDERQAGQVSLRNLDSQQEQMVALDAVVDTIRSH